MISIICNLTGGTVDKVYLNRHDIDTSPRVAREMFEIEKEVFDHTGSATYYFRESTLDRMLIKDIDEYEYETGYHYEELATYEKEHKLKNIDKLKGVLPECGECFLRNIARFRSITDSPCLSVASHGDYINTKYKIQNFEILKNDEIRNKSGIIVEAYDESIIQYVEVRYADQVLLGSFAEEVLKGIEERHNVIMTFTHSRNWKVDVIANTKDNIGRFWEGYKYKK